MSADALSVLATAQEFTREVLDFMASAKPRILELQQYARETEALLATINARIAEYEAHQAVALGKLKRIAEVMELAAEINGEGDAWAADT